MAQIKKLQIDDETLYPVTIPQAVVDPDSGDTLREELDSKDAVSNKTQTLTDSETDYPSGKAVKAVTDALQPKTITPISGMTATTVEEGLGELNSNEIKFKNDVFIENLIDNDPSAVDFTKKLSANGGWLITNTGEDTCVPKTAIKVFKDKTYAFFGYYPFSGAPRGTFSPTNTFLNGDVGLTPPVWQIVDGGYKTIAPFDGYLMVVLKGNVSMTELNNPVQITQSEINYPYTSFGIPIKIRDEYFNERMSASLKEDLYVENKLNNYISAFEIGYRLSANGGILTADTTSLIAACKGIRVYKDHYYSVKGFHPYAGTPPIRGSFSITNSFAPGFTKTAPVWVAVEDGYTCKAPFDGYLCVDFALNSDKTALANPSMVVNGDKLPYEHLDYEEKILANSLYFKKELEVSIAPEAINSQSLKRIYNLPPANNMMHKKLPLFFDHYLKRDIDINIVLVGDSIFARDFHTTYYSESEQTKRPPLLNSQNIASKIWDKLDWQNTEYARYDRAGVFTEGVGTFVTVITNSANVVNNGINATQWDDFNRRPSHTRMYTGTANATVQFAIAANVYKANFIYRTDLNGSQVNTVSVAEGSGKIQVWDKTTSAWVEANGYTFSMRHGAVETHRGNTKFQERLKFRTCDLYDGGSFDQRAGLKTITITKTDSNDTRFMYWGLEYSKEAFIMKLINSARGSLGISTMLPYFDDDVYDWLDEENTFTLIIHEIYLNQGSNQFASSKTIAEFISEWNDYAYSESNAYSIRERSKTGVTPWQKCEMIEWNPVGSAESGGINLVEPYGWAIQTNFNPPKTIFDNFMSYLRDYKDNYDETGLVFINMTTIMWKEAQSKYGREWYKAYQASGVEGESFLNDITHPNDYGCSVVASWINAALDFTYF